MANDYSDDQLRMVARLYYIDGMGQSDVARFAKVSQAKVSRLLALARERGIVRITIADYNPRRPELERELERRFGFGTVIVIKSNEGSDLASLRRSVGHFGASLVDEMIQPRDTVAVAGGRTLQELAQNLPEGGNKALTIVQAMGSVDSQISTVDSQEVGRLVAQRLGGKFLAMNTPAFIPTKRTRDALLALPQVSSVHQELDRANVALVGLGTLSNSVFVERGTVAATMARELERAGAIGEICGRFIDAEGRECDTGWRDRVISVELDQLRRMPQVVAVVSGADRTSAICAAVKGGLVKSLLIDEIGAAALLGTAPAEPEAKPRAARRAGR
ncbi:sugar-binding domain-containing protein [Opitutus sp. ER46]|uniref:sugar-binding transcriptional regulator n=1 Tax=Opitutus sp. ER46 TaxID=2161864 RepID=UPI000D2FE824|nr:sugar-binding domain-containing protein [Opitutus sp. ER46]PTY00108.1 transcriptional regulator [Opitutus sp. ER46]